MRRFAPHFIVASIVISMTLLGVATSLHYEQTDLRFQLSSRDVSGEVAVIAIDPKSIQEVGSWPWSRKLHADLVTSLGGLGTSDIAFDVDFSSSSNKLADEAFAEALKNAGGSVILPAFKQFAAKSDGEQTLHVNRPLKSFADHSWMATVNVMPEVDGTVRRYAYGEKLGAEFLPSLGALVAGEFKQTTSRFFLDYGIDWKKIPVYSFVDVLNGRVDSEQLRGKKIVVGATAIELGDRFLLPNSGMQPGPLLQALAAETIVQNRQLHVTGLYFTLAGLCFLALCAFVLWTRTGLYTRLAIFLAVGVALEVAAIVAQQNTNIILDTSHLMLALAAYIAVSWIYEVDVRSLVAKIAQQRFQRIAYSLGDGVICTDEHGKINFWNPGAEAIFGHKLKSVLGKGFEEVCLPPRENAAGANLYFDLFSLPKEKLTSPGGHLIELTGARNGGAQFPLEACFSAWFDGEDHQYGIILRDVTLRKRKEERIRQLAENDALTGLANRSTMRRELTERIAYAESQGEEVALLLSDLDNFKTINDTVGHQHGDELLCKFAKLLEDHLPDSGLAARLGGDEFVAIIDGPTARADAERFSRRLQHDFSKSPHVIDGQQFHVSTTMGLTTFPSDGTTVDELLANADLALYSGKDEGRGGLVPFEPQMRKNIDDRHQLEEEIGRAVEREEFEVYFQPQFRLSDMTLVGAEALIRWRHPDRGVLPPGAFISVLEAGPHANPVSNWILEKACRQVEKWRRDYEHDVRIGVNLTTSQFRANLPSVVRKTLETTSLPPHLLELEIKENILLDKETRAREQLIEIQNMGVGIALDDFGTGYASLSYLKMFPLNRLKIDRSFVQDLGADSDNTAIVSAVVSVGRNLGHEIIAEGIEEDMHVDLLNEIRCHEGQGYLFGRPMPAQDFEEIYLATKSGKGTRVHSFEDAKIVA